MEGWSRNVSSGEFYSFKKVYLGSANIGISYIGAIFFFSMHTAGSVQFISVFRMRSVRTWMGKVHVSMTEGLSTELKFHFYIRFFIDVTNVRIFLQTAEREVEFCQLNYNVHFFLGTSLAMGFEQIQFLSFYEGLAYIAGT
jgi:hypothetical protein